MSPYLRAFLFDPAHPSASTLPSRVFDTWSRAQAVCVLPTTYPKAVLDASIVRVDPNEVVDLRTGDSHIRELAICDTEDLAVVVLTSGTTADPTPVELSFSAMESSVDSLYTMCELTKNDTWLCCVSPHYVAGLAVFARSFVSGSRLVFHETFDVEKIRDALEDESISAMSLVPTQLKRLIDADVDLSSLRTVLVGGASLDDDLWSQSEQRGISIHRTYGMTETWGGICHDGKLFDNTRARITDGLIELQSGSLMSGYRHNFPLTHKRFTTDGWFQTGDRGKLVDGQLRVNGRSDDIIISGGIKVDPAPIERALRIIFPNYDIAVCATPHSQLGESVTACFVNADNIPSLTQIRLSISDSFPSTHLPYRVATVDALPLTSSGKLQRNELGQNCTIVEEHVTQG